MTTYQGLLIRDNFQDIGDIPTTGNIWTSPDIIPYGSETLSPAKATSTYSGPDIGQRVTNNTTNNIYVRSKNTETGTTTGYANLYYADASLFLAPATWLAVNVPVPNNNFQTATTPGSLPIPAGAIAMVQSPFTIPGVPTGTHWCFIAVAFDAGKTFNIPSSFVSNAAFYEWVENSPNVSYRNIILNVGSPANVASNITFGNTNSSEAAMVFTVASTGLSDPSGVSWSASCSDSRLPAPYSASGTLSSQGTASADMNVPANVNGSGNALMAMAWTFTNGNRQPFPSGTRFLLDYYQKPTPPDVEWLSEADRRLEEKLARPSRIAAQGRSDGVGGGMLIPLGSVEFVVQA